MTPRKREQLEAIRESSRNAILQAALRLFAERGYHATTIEAIAREAGIAKGLVYNYFVSKHELLRQLVLLGVREFEDLLPELLRTADPVERLHVLFELSGKLIREKTEFYRLYMMVLLQVNRDKELSKIIQEYSRTLYGETEEILRELGVPDVETEARLLAALLDGIGLHFIVLSGEYPLKDVLLAAERHYLAGSGKKAIAS